MDENLNNGLGGGTAAEIGHVPGGGIITFGPGTTPNHGIGSGQSTKASQNFVTHADLAEFKNGLIDAVKDIVKGPSEKPAKAEAEFRDSPVSSAVSEAQALVEAASSDTGYMPPQFQKIFERYFDPADGFEARLNFPIMDDKGREDGGITFTIVVPMKYSNAQQAYKDYYKADLRTRAVKAGSISQDITKWCQLVAKNLHYDKLVKMK